MQDQQILYANLDFSIFDKYLDRLSIRRVFLVCGRSIQNLGIYDHIYNMNRKFSCDIELYSDFHPNPEFESVVNGVDKFQRSHCDCILAVGGGSAIDVAKCIKLYGAYDGDRLKCNDPFNVSYSPFIVMPTTAGTGSEATRFAVVYNNGNKQSISDPRCIPSAVLFDPSVLSSLPLYQKKVTAMDALCHAIESFWSVHSSVDSEQYASKAICLILQNINAYLREDSSTYEIMLLASNYAGKAIDITQTTAGHAMSYKLTSMFGISHGHAVAICVRALWYFFLDKNMLCSDIRGAEFLSKSLERLSAAMGCKTVSDAARKFDKLFESLDLSVPHPTEEELNELSNSVNEQRLKNFPLFLGKEDIIKAYRIATKSKEKGK